ncbi:MAG: protein kinase [Zavarzinella sp.]
MPTPANIEDLLGLIRKSGMIDESRLSLYLSQLQSLGQLPNDVRKLAGAMVRDGLLTYFQAEQFLLGKWRGFTIGKYKLMERIGFGGMGQVFLCEHMYMRRRVAIKVLPPAKAEEPAALGRFYREARAAAALDHPNIVRTHDIDQDGNLHFLVMEYVDGSSLLEIVKKRGYLDPTRSAHYIWQSVQGLDHAYHVGVIHRDIKPGNILVDRYGISKILDMGLARFYHSDDDMLTKKYDEKSVLGTADYVAPEQTVNSHDVDIRADIYSLGATFYFILTGQPPFPEGSISQKLIAHQTREPKPVRELRPEIPVEMEAVLKKMMAKSVEERYQTPLEVYEALLPFVQEPVAPPPEDEMPLLSPAAREQISSHGGAQTGSYSFRQDSAILRAELMQRSGSMSKPGSSSGLRRPGSGSMAPPAATATGSSSNIQPAYFEPPGRSPLGSAANPPVPNPTRPVNETEKMAQTSTSPRNPQIPQVGDPRLQQRSAGNSNDPAPNRGGLLKNTTVRILLEAVIVMAICVVGYFLFTKFFS